MDPPEETMLIGEAFQGSRLSPVLPKTALAGFDAAKFLPKSGIATTLAGFDTANLLGAAMALSSALGTSSLAATFTGGQESLLPGLPISRLARDTGLTAGFRRTQDFSAPPPGSSASLTATTSEWSGLSDIRELRELATRMAQSVDGPVGEQASSNDTASSSWIRRHNVELALFIAMCSLAMALLAWLFPRSTPTPVQVRVVWSIVQSCFNGSQHLPESHSSASHRAH